MNPNPLLSELNQFGNSIATSKGMLFQLNSHLSEYKRILVDRFEPLKSEDFEYPILASTLIIGDLTGTSDKGWKINFPTGYSYQLEIDNISDRIDLLISREAMRCIAHGYEALEKFIYDIISKFLSLNKTKYTSLTTKYIKSHETLEETRDSIRTIRGKNNRDILSFLRKISPIFSSGELTNNENINLKEWYEVLSRVRHGITHANFKIIEDNKFKLTSEQIKILNKYFPNEPKEKFYDLKIDKESADKILNLMTEYGFFIFKSLSEEVGYNWKVFNDMG